MKISYPWLKSYLPLDLPAEKVAEYLTDTGLEVEGLERVEAVPGGLKGVVVGEVMECVTHPNADRLKLCQVKISSDETVQIVCGAPNVVAGQKVPVATVGTELPAEEGSFKIKKGKIRGEVSMGMICAEDELGLGDDHDGIMVLDPKASVGSDFAEYLGLEAEEVIEIGLTPNRTDAICHYGVARDLKAALLRHGMENLDLSLPSVAAFQVHRRDKKVKLSIQNKEACYRYMGLSITGVKVDASPEWLQKRLRAIGLKPINNIVDITNFVLHETGHPLHAFDLAKIHGQEIQVKNLAAGTSFTTLDGTEIKLHAEDLMICDAERPLVLAGVYGGLESGVTEQSTEVFLEAAYFNPVSVRKAAKRHGLNTDSSFRYERGVDPEMTEYALKRAATLILELAGGEVAMEIADEHPVKVEPQVVQVNLDRMNTLIGQELDSDMVKNILASLEIRVLAESGPNLQLEVPAYRHDVTREADVVEEVLRIYGFNSVPYDGPMRISVAQIDEQDDSKEREIVSAQLAGRGFNEMMSNSLTKEAYYHKYGFKAEHSVKMINPLSQDLGVMRQSLVFGGLETISYNQRRQRPDARLFEFGRQYAQYQEKYHEEERLALWISGQEAQETWRQGSKASDFYTLKLEVEALLKRLGVDRWQETALASEGIWQEGLRYKLGKITLVDFGLLDAKLLQDFDLKAPVYFADVYWSNLFNQSKKKQLKMRDLPRFPGVRRDLALLVNREVAYGDLAQAAQKAGGALLREVNLFDVYEGKNLPEGKKSYAMSFTFRHDEKTLNDKAVEQMMNKILSALQKQFEASLR